MLSRHTAVPLRYDPLYVGSGELSRLQEPTSSLHGAGLPGLKPGAEDILHIGLPNWRLITPAELSMPPWRSLCYVEVRDRLGNVQSGTGWFAGKQTVITAAHVVSPPWNGEVWEVTISPTGMKAVAADVRVHPLYTGDTSRLYDPHDIAAISVPTLQGWPLAFEPPSFSQALVEIPGFPGPAVKQLFTGLGQMFHRDLVLLLHQVDTQAGHSGAPVILRDGPRNGAVIGLHTMGPHSNPHSAEIGPANVALAMTGDLGRFINDHVRVWG